MSENYDNKRIVHNSALLYFRMFFTMGLNLWATRLVLHNLGADDMGLYGVISGITGLTSIITDGASTAIQRFIVYERGEKKNENDNTNKVFCSAVNVTIIFSLIIIIIMEPLSFFLNDIVNVPLDKKASALYVYQFAIISCILNFISIPYNSLIIAYEKINVYAWISILNVILGWGSAWLLSIFPSNERLKVYGLLCCSTCVIVRICYQAYCHYHFREAKYHFMIDKQMIKKMMNFSGLATFSGALQAISAQTTVIIINWIFGAAINAVYMIALQLKNSVLSFGFNIFKAISPQITKTYAENDKEHCSILVYEGAKIEALMVGAIMIPFIFKSRYILKLWLGDVPQYTQEFCIFTIFISLTYAIIAPISILVQATGRIKRYMTIPDIFYLLTVTVLSFSVSYITKNPVLTIAAIVSTDILCCMIRIIIAQKETFLSVKDFTTKVLFPVLTVLFLSAIVCYILTNFLGDNIYGLIILLASNTAILSFLSYFFALTKSEQKFIAKNAEKIILLIKK